MIKIAEITNLFMKKIGESTNFAKWKLYKIFECNVIKIAEVSCIFMKKIGETTNFTKRKLNEILTFIVAKIGEVLNFFMKKISEVTNFAKRKVDEIFVFTVTKYSKIVDTLKNNQTLFFIILLNVLTLYVIFFSLTYLFQVNPFSNITLSNLCELFPNVETLLSKLNITKVKEMDISEILLSLVGASSAILAIVFSLTIIGIERVSEKYTPFIAEKYRNNRITRGTLFSFVILIVFSVLLIFIHKLISEASLLFYSIGILFGFTICISLLIMYFYFIIKIIDPISFSSILESEIIGYIKKEKRNEANKLIVNMGDIAIRSLQREEKNVATKYVNIISDIFIQCCYEFKKINYLSPMLDSYQRILNYCIQTESDLRFTIISFFAEIPSTFHFTEKINENVINRFDTEVFDEYQNYLDKLYYINKGIINKNDFELFKDEINSISMHFVDDPKKLIEDIKYELLLIDLYNSNEYQGREIISRTKCLDVMINTLEINFSNFEFYEKTLKKFETLFLFISEDLNSNEEVNKLDEKLKTLRESLFKFYLDSNFHKTFFIVGAYCLFSRENKNIESDKYIRELWLHTKPKDSYVISCNEVPVTSDIEFLFNMLFWGGNNNGFWFDKYSFEGFHDSRNYLYKYTILLLTYLRERQNKDLNIQISRDMDEQEIEFRYSFFKRFILEANELVMYCEEFIGEPDKWSFLLPPQKQKINDLEFIDISTKEQLENTKKWIQNKKEEFEQKVLKFDVYLPLDPGKVSNCKNEILDSFSKYSEICNTVSLSSFDAIRDNSLKFIQIGYRPITPKECFVSASNVDCSSLWFGYGRNVAFGEINYFVEHILSGDAEKIQVESEDILGVYDSIESIINEFYVKGFKPSTIFLPLDVLYAFIKEAQKEESKLYGKFSYSTRDIFNFNEHTKLKIIRSSNFTNFDEIIILDKNFCIWTFKSIEDNGRLIIEIKDYEKDPSKVDLLIKTVINLRISDFNAIKVISLKKTPLISYGMHGDNHML